MVGSIVEKIAMLGHDLAIPSYVMEHELVDKTTLKITKEYVRQGKIWVLRMNTADEIRRFRIDVYRLGPGECDLILTYRKLLNAGERTCCILDDLGARRKAAKMGIGFTGLIGLLQMIKKRNLMSHDEIDKIVGDLKNSNFRFPADVSI